MPYSRAFGINALLLKLNGMRDKLEEFETFFEVRLMGAPLTQTPSRVPTDFTQSTFLGYAPVDYSFDNLEDAVNDGGEGKMVGTPVANFVNSGSEATVYGYYCVGQGPGGLIYLWGETFETPVVLGTGGSIGIKPTLYDQSLGA